MVPACLMVSGTATVVVASDSRVVVGAAVGGSSQSPGKSDRPYLGPGFGGTTESAVIFGDAVLRSVFSVGGEASPAGNLSGEQVERVPGGANQLSSTHRDSIFSGVVKARWSPVSRIQIAGGGGAGLAHRHTVRTGNFVRDFPAGLAGPVAETLTDNVLALTGLVDATVLLNGRFGIAALFRVYKLHDEDRLPDGVVKRGVSSVVVRYGAGGLVRF